MSPERSSPPFLPRAGQCAERPPRSTTSTGGCSGSASGQVSRRGPRRRRGSNSPSGDRRTLEDIGRLYDFLDARRNHATMLSPFGAGSACAGTGGIRGARLITESVESGLVALGASDSS